jgi:hypothetical protein
MLECLQTKGAKKTLSGTLAEATGIKDMQVLSAWNAGKIRQE